MFTFIQIVKQQNAWRTNEPEVKFEFAVDVVDVVLCEGDGVVQHVLELGQHVRDLPHDHRQGRDTGVRPRRYVSALGMFWLLTVLILATSEYVDVNLDK